MTTFETRGGLHAHIVFLGNHEIAERLKSSTAFGKFIQVDPVTYPVGLVRKYLAKERTPQDTICSVVAFADHIASTAGATVCVSPVILSGTQSTLVTSSPGSTPTRDDPQSAKLIGCAAYIRPRPLALPDSFRSCPS